MTTFYLASSWSFKRESSLMARTISAETGWQCTSTWLTRAEDRSKESDSAWAEKDLTDIRRAAYFVCLSYPSSYGGKWVELGYAYLLARPIFYLYGYEYPRENNLFLNLPEIRCLPSINQLVKEINR